MLANISQWDWSVNDADFTDEGGKAPTRFIYGMCQQTKPLNFTDTSYHGGGGYHLGTFPGNEFEWLSSFFPPREAYLEHANFSVTSLAEVDRNIVRAHRHVGGEGTIGRAHRHVGGEGTIGNGSTFNASFEGGNLDAVKSGWTGRNQVSFQGALKCGPASTVRCAFSTKICTRGCHWFPRQPA
jgi:hypothetical protein